MTQENFYLSKERMLLKIKKRTEKHGDEEKNAYDAMLTADFPNAVLLKLDSELRGVFYAPDHQADIEADYFPNLRFALMGPVAWGLEKSRMALTVHDAEFPAEDITLDGKDMDKVHFIMKEGGTVTLGLRVILGQLEEDELIKLLRVDNQRVPVSLVQIELAPEPDNFEQADLLSQAPHSEARAEAEALFGKPIGAQSPEELVGLPIEEAPEVE